MDYLKPVIKTSLFAGLVLVLLFSLVSAPLPAQASPETNVWSKYPIPLKGESGGWVLTGGGTGVTAICAAFDGTIYAATQETSGSPLNGYNLFKSTDGGYAWTPLWRIPAGDKPSGGEDSRIIALILPRWEDASVLYLATQHNIYRTTDGGGHFNSLGRPPSTSGANPSHHTLITSFSVTPQGGTRMILVGTRDSDNGDYGGAYFFDESRPLTPWTDLRVGGYVADTRYDVLAVGFSPDFTDDQQVVAVITDETNTIITTKFGGSNWGGTIGDAVLPGLAATSTSLAFPADYDSAVSEGKYVQYVGLDVGGVTGGLFIITGVETPNSSLAIPVFFPAPVHSVAATGAAFSPTVVIGEGLGPLAGSFAPPAVVAGLTNGGVVSIATGVAYTPPSAPPAQDTCVALGGFHGAGYFVYAGTSGANGGFARSVDTGATFARTAFIADDLERINDLAVSPIYDKDSTIYMITQGQSGNQILWRTTNGGQTWDAILTEGQPITNIDGSTKTVGTFDKVALSPRFTSDTTVFLYESATDTIWRSTDNGFRFWALPLKVPTTGTIDSWAVAGIKKVLVGDNRGNLYKTSDGGLTWSQAVATGLSGFSSLVLSPDYNNDHTILAADDTSRIYLSADDGNNWQKPTTSTTGLSGSTLVAFSPHYAKDKTIYATSADSGIRRLVIGEDSHWQRIDQVNPNRIEETANITGIALADDGDGLSVLYAASSDPVVPRIIGKRAAQGGIARSLNPTSALSPSADAPLFEVVNAGLPSNTGLFGLWCAEGHTLWSIDTAATPMVLYTYTDTVTSSPKPTSPPNGASSGRQTSGQLSWEAVTNALSYEIWYDTDPSFKQSPTRIYSTVARAELSDLSSGITYYWRVRVGQPGISLFTGTPIAIGAPALSRFSAIWSFTTALGGSQWSPFSAPGGIAPLPGTTNVSIRPNFQWNPADQATGYELIVARDNNFTDVVVAKIGDNALSTPAWACEQDLDYNTTYYWKVRAINPASYSEWAVGVFTTEPAPPALPSPPAPLPPSPAPATPVSIWVMLAIMVALVIALLWLIVISRRS